VSGEIAIEGEVGERLSVEGRIENEQTEIRLINRLPPSVVPIDVEFADPGAGETTTTAAAEDQASGSQWILLDLAIDLPGRVFVRGRGVESEWGGSLAVTGTAAQPKVSGKLEPVRGFVDFLGKRFVIEEGEIRIMGLDQDIMLEMTASYEKAAFNALIIVSGTAAKPEITLASEPELPQDEILARVLFDKSTGNLSAFEAAQLAAAAATLASGEPGVLDKLRSTTGLSRLTIGSSERNDGAATVEAGKNIGENVYVGVEQGATAGSTEAVAEIEITDEIKLRSTATAEGSNRVGVQWEWDY
jgi:translocation and assembly module TamB